MTPTELAAVWEDALLGQALVYLLIAALVAGYVAFEWKASRRDRDARKYRRRVE